MPGILISMPAINLMEQAASFSIQIYAKLYSGSEIDGNINTNVYA